MNMPTKIVFVLVLWLVMGIGFMSKASEVRRRGKGWLDAWLTTEGLLFLASLAAPLILLIHSGIQ